MVWDKYSCINSQCNRMFVPKYCSECGAKDHQLCPTCHENEHFFQWFSKKFGIQYKPLRNKNELSKSELRDNKDVGQV